MTLEDGPAGRGRQRPRRRGRADDHPRRHAVRRRHGRRAPGRDDEPRRPAAVRRRLDRGDLRALSRRSARSSPRWATATPSSRELEETINATPCDVVVTGTPIDLARLIDIRHPIRHATYDLADHGRPTLADALLPFVEVHQKHLVTAGAVDDYAS